MSRIESTMIPLGTKAPDFKLPDTVTQNEIALSDIKSDIATVVMFICNHCPYVIHIRQELVNLAKDYLSAKICFIAISSNDIEKYPEDSPEKMRELAESLNYPFPYLYDESQEVAKAYDAQCTPDFFIFDKNLHLVYRGQFDDSRPGNDIKISGKDIRDALDSILEGKEVSPIQKPSIGCNIKWK